MTGPEQPRRPEKPEQPDQTLLEWRVDPDGEDGLLTPSLMVGKVVDLELVSVGLFLAPEDGAA